MKTIVVAALLALSFTTGFTCSKNTPAEAPAEQAAPAEAAPAAEAAPTEAAPADAAAPTEGAPADAAAAPAEGTTAPNQ